MFSSCSLPKFLRTHPSRRCEICQRSVPSTYEHWVAEVQYNACQGSAEETRAVREVLRVWTCLRRVRMRRKSSQDCGVENRGQPFDWRGPNRVATLQMGSIVRDQKVGPAHAPPQGECENLLYGFKVTTLKDKRKQQGSRKNLRWK